MRAYYIQNKKNRKHIRRNGKILIMALYTNTPILLEK